MRKPMYTMVLFIVALSIAVGVLYKYPRQQKHWIEFPLWDDNTALIYNGRNPAIFLEDFKGEEPFFQKKTTPVGGGSAWNIDFYKNKPEKPYTFHVKYMSSSGSTPQGTELFYGATKPIKED